MTSVELINKFNTIAQQLIVLYNETDKICRGRWCGTCDFYNETYPCFPSQLEDILPHLKGD